MPLSPNAITVFRGRFTSVAKPVIVHHVQLGLVAYGEIGLAGRHQPRRRIRIGRGQNAHIQALRRVIAAILGGVIGVVLGALLTVYNGYTATIGGQPVWLGVILGSIVLAALFTGFRLAFGTRIVPGFAAVGAVVIIGILSLPSTAGSVLVTQSGPGLLWEIAPPVIAFLVLVWPQFPRRGPGKVKK